LDEWKNSIEKKILKKNTENAEVLQTSIAKNAEENLKFKKKKLIEEFDTKNTELSNKFTKFANFEKLISQLITQINNLRNNNLQWQSDFLKNMNDFNDKIMNQEILLDSFEKFEKSTDKKIEIICEEIKGIKNIPKNFEKNLEEKENEFKEKFTEKLEEITKLNENKEKLVKDELLKMELNVKALWDSFTYFSDSVNNNNGIPISK